MPKSLPITIGNDTYKSRRAAARALGVSVQAICNAIDNSMLETVGLGNKIAIEIEGKVYESIAEAARAKGKSRQAMWKQFNKQMGNL